jgi:hypothetical protein
MVTDIWVFSDRVVALDLTGFDVQATDGRVGKVERSRGERGLQHLAVDAQPSLPGGRRLIIPAGLIDSVDTNARRVNVDRSRDELRNAPAYDDARGVDLAYRADVDTYSGRAARSRDASGRRAARARRAGGAKRVVRDDPAAVRLAGERRRGRRRQSSTNRRSGSTSRAARRCRRPSSPAPSGGPVEAGNRAEHEAAALARGRTRSTSRPSSRA